MSSVSNERLTGLTRPVIGIENRTAQEVFDIMCDRIKALSSLEASPAPVSEEWLDPSTAPKDGTIVRLLVKPDMEAFTSLQDSEDAFETIGFNHSDESGEDTWHFAGWDWAHDCITQGHGEVIGWAAFSSLAALAAKGGQ